MALRLLALLLLLLALGALPSRHFHNSLRCFQGAGLDGLLARCLDALDLMLGFSRALLPLTSNILYLLAQFAA